ncbi:GtrA family protein [Granulicella sibirica]|uniref:GtrA/DPMS transmembrane domain-containing protein n=1 Tax=Granulicella sibirica TaxID=2479048 RepID=A0A4Q0T3E8_9BACT|nr:GtrA family protein [Granulicella sibirica]RXH56499.1 hypothetical protein GRAN_3356 [Granulicella sibirica]
MPISQDPFLPKSRLQRLVGLFPKGQFIRYLCVGVFNTLFGYGTFVITLALLNAFVPAPFLPLTVVLASIISTPFNITVAYFGYKLFVFRTKGNHLIEWLRCFAVYGTGMIPGLLALSALTRFFQTSIDAHHTLLASALHHTEAILHLGSKSPILQKFISGKTAPGNIAGAIVTGFSTIYSFVGHKKFSFKPAKARTLKHP